ncbi:26S proteasome regulatory complex, non-ATPase subcomplex, Rpn1 subunit [Gymnopus androsaceus JB14]|uniref:26S proteasome regulatory subunit RPN1 n=1 Tax=Gymnopus androsaceus JB14 TaxID=1447944 RepID=A0A6A4GSH1_9AGAR|nr:26S proteasome regulatory complex, non-ATPase subcomplex, Rpn1 subunit [Gymnopus androsaceus JB14]
MSDPTKVAIAVPSKDPKAKKPEETDKEEGTSKKSEDKDKKDEDKPEGEGDELSEEDLQLRSELEMLVERLKESNTDLHLPTLELLRTLIRTSTSSMTSVPKPLKFLRPHFPDLQALYETWPASENKSHFADILSVLAMTYSDTQPRGTLKYRLLSASLRPANSPLVDPGTWGHEYVRHLAAELGEEFEYREVQEDGAAPADSETPKVELPGTMEDLRSLAKECSSFLLNHNAEPDAVDLLQELEMIEDIVKLVDENTFDRVCQYMTRCVNFLPPPDDITFLQTVHKIYTQFHKFPEAIGLAIRLGDRDMVRDDFNAAGNPVMKRQLAFILARAQIPIEWLQAEDEEEVEEFPSDLLECLSNTRLSASFREYGKEMGVSDAKSLEDVYKSHLENTRASTSNIESARGNLAGTFVNAFVNAGFGNDKLMVEAEEGSSWIYKNKDHGMMSATASLGLSLLWDTEMGLTHMDKYTYSSEEYIKAGCYLAIGISNASIRTETDAALALLAENVENPSVPLRTGAIMGLGMAYAGSQREEVMATLLPYVVDEDVTMEISSLAALALGFVFVGSENGEITGTILQVLMEKAEREDKELEEKWARFMALGLGLIYLGQQNGCDATLETLKAIEKPISKTAQIIVEACAFAGTTNVLRVQKMLHECDEHILPPKEEEKKESDKEKKDEKKEGEETKDEPPLKKDDTFQTFAVIAVALISMGEEIGSQMSMRQFNHLMHYGEPNIRKAVPLAIGLVNASNPQLPILETLSKYSHDNDLAVALNAIFAMGLVGAGSNNARLAQMLRQLAGYYHKEADCLFMVRIAQGLVHMGKGTIGFAGLLAVLTAFTDAKGFILDKQHWMLYFLVTAMYPRFMITVDEKLNNLPVAVRVGQSMWSGKPGSLARYRVSKTHTTPVRLGTTERAELATEEFIPYASNLEGFVILKKNPGWESEDNRMQL